MSLLFQSQKFPLSSGVYLFLNKDEKVLYVGRATSLKRRVSNYFQKKLDPRTREMLSQAKHIKYLKTENVLGAIILEANLIKKYWPKYNVRERDNRSFVYFFIPKGGFPRPLIVRQRELEKFAPSGYLFGPYRSLALLKGALRIIRKIFPYSTCAPFSGKPCFEYQLGLCPGLCVGAVSKEEYSKNIRNIILLLGGRKKSLLNKLKKENPEKFLALKHIQDVSLVSREGVSGPAEKFGRIEAYDISHFSGKETFGSMAVFSGGAADKSQYRLFKIRHAPANDDLRALEETITRRLRHKEWPFPDLILIDGGKPQVDYISKVLQILRVNISLAGISKFGKDKLVFPAKTRKSLKELINSAKNVLLEARNEAHRFALKSSRRKRAIKIKKNYAGSRL